MLRKLHYSRDAHEPSPLPNNRALANVFKSVSDDKSLSILQAIAAAAIVVADDGSINSNNNNNEQIRLKELDLTTKQYYTRISAMMETDLIKKRGRRYYLTPFGKVIYCCIMITKNALKNYYNLKAVEVNQDSGFSDEEISKLVDALIDNQHVREFLVKKC
jgi:hypothetical protein